MRTYSYYVNTASRLLCPSNSQEPITSRAALPIFIFGEDMKIAFTFPASTLEEGETLMIGVDTDMFSGGDYASMINEQHTVTSEEASGQSPVEVTLHCNFASFLDKVNGIHGLVDVFFAGYVVHLDGSQDCLFDQYYVKAYARGVVVLPDDPRIVLPNTIYYNREQIDQIVNTMNTQAGAAEQAKVDAIAAKDAAVSAKEAALQAKSDAVDAKNAAISAKDTAVSAKEGAVQAKNDAVTAKNDAVSAKNAAVSARDAALQAKSDAVDAKNAAVSAKDAAVSAKEGSVQAKNDAVSAKDTAVSAKNAAISARDAALQAKSDAVDAKNAAVSAKDAALQAKSDAVDAKNAAVSAKDAALQAKSDAVDAKNAAVTAKNAAVTAKEGAEAALDEFQSRLSSSYIYGIDWKDADLTQDKAGKCVVLNNIYDNVQYDTSLRYMQVEAHGVLPAHNWRRCTMRTARTVNYYLHQSNSNLKADGTAAVLTGADGDVMVDIDIVYFRIDTYTDDQDVTHYVWLCSDKPFNGSRPYPFFYVSPDGKTLRKQFVSAFRSCICDADGNTLNNNRTATADTTYQADKTYYSRSANVFTKLAPGTDYTVGGTITQGQTVDTKIYEKTVVSTPTGYSAGRKCRSVAGAIPSGNITRANYRAAHANNGFDSIHFLFGSFLGMMMGIEYGTISAQAKFSVGYSNLSAWDFRSMRLTGRTAVFGNNSGEIIADDIDSNGEDYDLLVMKSGGTSLWNTTAQSNHAQRVVQCSYHGVEDPFGSQFTLDEGIQKNQDAEDISITYDGNVYLRDADDDPVSINLYCWKNPSSTKFYTTSATPSVGLNLYANTAMSTVTGTVASVEDDTITVGTTIYTRSSTDDTTGHSYAWKYGSSIIYSHVVNPHTDANTRQVFSDAQLTDLLGNVTAVADDYSESGYWFTTSTAKYSYLDTNRGRLKGDEYVFPPTGYTGEEAVWVHQEWPKYDTYPSDFDRVTFLPKHRSGNWGSTTKGLCDRSYNNANAGACVCARGGNAHNGGYDGPFSVNAYYGLANAYAIYGSRSAA